MTSAYRVVAPPGRPQPPMTAMLQAAALPHRPPTARHRRRPPPRHRHRGRRSADRADRAGAAGPGATAPSAPGDGRRVHRRDRHQHAAAEPDPGPLTFRAPIAGTGQAAAASYLGRLRDVAARYPVLVLPYGDPDVVALVRAGQSRQVSTTVQHGREVATRVLGDVVSGDAALGGATTGVAASTVNTSTAYPINGATDGETLAALSADGLGHRPAVREFRADRRRAGRRRRGRLPTGPDGPVPAVDRPARRAQRGRRVDRPGPPIRLGDAGERAHRRPRPAVAGRRRHAGRFHAGPAVVAGRPRAAGDHRAARHPRCQRGDQRHRAVRPGGLRDRGGGTADYPQPARAQELPAEYLDRISSSRADVASLRQTFASTRQTSDPNLVLDPLDLALDAAASTAFRSDPAVGEANLATVEATTAGLRTGVEISSAGNSYTLASSTSPLVLTVQNNLPYDAPVRVQISGGERVGLTVDRPGGPGGAGRPLAAGADSRRGLPVGAVPGQRAAGRRGRRGLGSARATVRRTPPRTGR